jgi:non-ribosomal peptide synthetase component F
MSEPRTLRSLLDSLAEHGDRQAVLAIKEQGAEPWSYRELAKHSRRLAHGLTAIGVGRGDNVALLAANRPEWMVACLERVWQGSSCCYKPPQQQPERPKVRWCTSFPGTRAYKIIPTFAFTKHALSRGPCRDGEGPHKTG